MSATTTDFAARGREILQFAATADREAWQNAWERPVSAFGEAEDCWTQFTLVTVSDFEAELGFFADALGFDCFMVQGPTADQPEAFRMAMMAPGPLGDGNKGEYVMAFREADADHPAIAPGSVQYEFMPKDLTNAWNRMTAAGAQVVREPWNDGWMEQATLRTPSGIDIQLWSTGTAG